MKLYDFWDNNKTNILNSIDNIDVFFEVDDDKTKLYNQFDNVISLCGNWNLLYGETFSKAFIINEFQKFTYFYKTLGETLKQLKTEGVKVSLNDINFSYLENHIGYGGFDLNNQDGSFQKNIDKNKQFLITDLTNKINKLLKNDFPKMFWDTAETIRIELLQIGG